MRCTAKGTASATADRTATPTVTRRRVLRFGLRLPSGESGGGFSSTGANDTNGTDLKLWYCNGGTNQQWSFANTTTYLYDAGGNRLIEETGSSRTLYLGEAEITVNKAGQAIDAVRYYSSPGAPTTVRNTGGRTTGHKLSLLVADHHNTATTSIDQSPGQAVTRRKSDPYGNPRGGRPTEWPGSRTYLGTGNDDNTTSLTHIGAREYEPATGRFISVDPVIDITDPLQMNGYTYSAGNPISGSDPTGLRSEECGTLYDCKGHSVITLSNASTTATSYVKPAAQLRYYQTHLPTPGPGKKSQAKSRDRILGHLLNNAGKLRHPGDPIKDASQFLYGSGQGMADVADAIDPFGPVKKISGLPSNGDQYRWLMGKLGVDTGDLAYKLGEIFGPTPGGLAGAAEKGASKLERLVIKCLEKNSFTSGTGVLLANGETKPIEELEVGDKVLATDPETGETTPKDVTATIYTEDDKTYTDVNVATDDGVETIHTTDHHAFWSESAGAWIDAADLKPGMTLRTDKGTSTPISSVRTFSAAKTTYNLTVADLHTYYVLAGQTSVLVHNAGGDPGTPNIILRGLQQIADGTLQQRMNPDGTPDFYKGGNNRKTAWWEGAKIYAPDPNNHDYRILEKNGQYKWVGPHGNQKGAGHNYNKLMDIAPRCP
ncbi:polymorphic toxin-type HINT domain-containing protein [Streptomyces goshikiensis]|uniref:polymorphic toxin-type HINT domain-containing protein n=1 Tax=Streptomyces goshikiensis TaxID=1942 RepID=UPI003679932F